MINVVASEDVIRELVVDATLLDEQQVIFAHEAGDRPDKPFVTIKITAITRIGTDARNVSDSAGDAEIEVVGNRELSVSVQVFGPGAMQFASAIQSATQTFSPLDKLRQAGVVFLRDNGMRDISAELETISEPRASLDLVFGVASTVIDSPGTIDQVRITGDISDRDDAVDLTVVDPS